MTRGMKILIASLGLSLAANFLFVGFAIGTKRAEQRTYVEAGDRHMGTRTLRALASVVPEDKRHETRKQFRELRRQSRENFRKIAEQRRAIGDLLRAETIDEAALQSAFDELHKTTRDLQTRGEKLTIGLAKDIGAEDRRALLDRMEQNRQSRRERFHQRQ